MVVAFSAYCIIMLAHNQPFCWLKYIHNVNILLSCPVDILSIE